LVGSDVQWRLTTLVARREYNCGRLVRRHQWLFGGIQRGSGRAFLRLVRRRNAPTLLRLIGKFIRPGTTIISDCWRAYSQIAALPNAYRHLQVNHQLNFVDPQTGAHTQNVGSLWQK
uniref:DDE_Tnp_IS1595 domain-containing protein n=1 Tax=Haemonchus placei TaxID=6290 RepID=A0A0N4WFM2_HAEPC